jgi:hypothetical protein
MAGIRPIFTFPGKTECFHLCISPAELATTTRRNGAGSLVVEFEIFSVFKGKFVFLSHETGMEAWPAFQSRCCFLEFLVGDLDFVQSFF